MRHEWWLAAGLLSLSLLAPSATASAPPCDCSAPLVTRLDPIEGHAEGEPVPVRLHAQVTEVGTLALWCEATKGTGRWKLEFNVREPGTP